MYLVIIFFPLFSALISGFFSYFLGIKGSTKITFFFILLTTFFSYGAFYEIGLCGSTVHLEFFPWIESDLLLVSWGFLFDSLTVVMLVVITTVSCLVHLYSIEYMSGDQHLSRFMSYLSLFTFFMILLVTANNYLQMFVGWEGVGLCSYLLINFWFTRIQANKAAIQAMLINRIGDFGLALGIMVIFYEFKAIDYATVFALVPKILGNEINFMNIRVSSLTIISLLLFIGSVGKSAQVGLHTWLPNAMEGPTPVSALIHAATMVTAGVFLLARSSPVVEYSPEALKFITFIGATTALFAATVGLLQNDLKKVIAYSTCSQLGYMIFACGLSAYSVGIFHLVNHAFFKALLFLSAGSIIHASGDEQDLRRMGALVKVLPYSYAMVFIGSLALMGFPFLSGFYSKDVILEVAFASYNLQGHFAYWLGTIAAFFTAFYSVRVLYLVFISYASGFKNVFENAHEGPWQITLPLFILSLGSLFSGYVCKDFMIGLGSNFWLQALYVHPSHYLFLDAEFMPHFMKVLPVFFSICGGFFAFFLYSFWSLNLYEIKVKSSFGRSLYFFFNRKWFFDKIYSEFFVQSFLHTSYQNTYKLVDRGTIEMFGPYGVSDFFYKKSKGFSKFQSGYLYHYSLIMLLGLCGPFFILLSYSYSMKIFNFMFLFFFLVITFFWKNRLRILNTTRLSKGSVAEWFNALGCKPSTTKFRWFESNHFHLRL